MNGIQAELNPCSGNSTVSDFRLNKGTMFYFYPCLRKEGWLTRTPKLLLVPHMCGEEKAMCVRARVCGRHRDTELRRRREVHAGAARRALICRLPSPDQNPDSRTPLPHLRPPSTGASQSSPTGEAAGWNELFPFRDGKAARTCPVKWLLTLPDQYALSPLCAAIAREQKQAGKWGGEGVGTGGGGLFVYMCQCVATVGVSSAFNDICLGGLRSEWGLSEENRNRFA